MSSERIVSTSEEATLGCGQELAEKLVRPAVILLYGELGAGKTLLTRGIAKGLGLRDLSLVHSPSFSLVNEYSVPNHMIFHIDLYRLETSRDLYSIGLDEILDSGEYVIIEWAEKLLFRIEEAVKIRIGVMEDDAREILIETDEQNLPKS